MRTLYIVTICTRPSPCKLLVIVLTTDQADDEDADSCQADYETAEEFSKTSRWIELLVVERPSRVSTHTHIHTLQTARRQNLWGNLANRQMFPFKYFMRRITVQSIGVKISLSNFNHRHVKEFVSSYETRSKTKSLLVWSFGTLRLTRLVNSESESVVSSSQGLFARSQRSKSQTLVWLY